MTQKPPRKKKEKRYVPEVMQTGKELERRLLSTFMDVNSEEPFEVRLQRMGMDWDAARRITGGITFDDELYEHCRTAILLPAMAKVLYRLASKAEMGDKDATKTYLELMGKIKGHGDVNVQMVQLQSLSDNELDRRIESRLSQLGLEE